MFLYLSLKEKTEQDVAFTIAGAALRDSHGNWVDVAVSGRVDSGLLGAGQQKLAEFLVPEGMYSRLKLVVKDAEVRREGERYSLAVSQPDGVYEQDIDLVVVRGECQALFAYLAPGQSVVDRYLLVPRISIVNQATEMRNLSLFVTDSASDAVTVVDRQRMTVVAAFAVGGRPLGLAYAADDKRLYVACAASRSIAVVDPSAGRVTATIGTFGYAPEGVVVTSNGRYLFATNPAEDSVSVVDLRDNAFQEKIDVDTGPSDIAYASERNMVYVASRIASSLAVINGATPALERKVALGFRPDGIAVHGDSLYVASDATGSIHVLDLPSCVETTVIPLPRPRWVLSGISDRVYVSSPDDGALRIVHEKTGSATSVFALAGRPARMAVDRERRILYVTTPDSDTVVAIDLVANTVIDVLHVGREPFDLTVVDTQ
ncbi:MAG: YncE family protein [Desulfovibrionaceae bacterium]